MEDSDMSEDKEWLAEVAAPPPREHKQESLKRRVEAIVRLYRITFGNHKGKRCIYADSPIPKQDYDLLAEGMRKGLV